MRYHVYSNAEREQLLVSTNTLKDAIDCAEMKSSGPEAFVVASHEPTVILYKKNQA